MAALAPELGLSDVGLKKPYAHLKIPSPLPWLLGPVEGEAEDSADTTTETTRDESGGHPQCDLLCRVERPSS